MTTDHPYAIVTPGSEVRDAMLLALSGRKITAEAQRMRRRKGMNFNVPVLKNGIRRVVLNYNDISASSAPLR